MGSLFQILMGRQFLRPLTRVVVGLIAIPLFRLFLRRVIKLQELNNELEKDLELWFRGSLLLLVATANMEGAIFGWIPFEKWEGDYKWMLMGFRIMLAIGVVQSMPDQELFAVIHPGPPRLKYTRTRPSFLQFREQFRPVCKGFVCKHLNQSSPVFAILAAIAEGWVGWFCYIMAIAQYLVIGLVTSRDRAYDVLSVFDEQVAKRRRELIEEFDLEKNSDAIDGAIDGTPGPSDSVESSSPSESPNPAGQAPRA
ncbi:MAG: DNA topoisomerase I [Planctomycetaceae bacterium]